MEEAEDEDTERFDFGLFCRWQTLIWILAAAAEASAFPFVFIMGLSRCRRRRRRVFRLWIDASLPTFLQDKRFAAVDKNRHPINPGIFQFRTSIFRGCSTV